MNLCIEKSPTGPYSQGDMQPTSSEFKDGIDPVEATGCQVENETVLLCYAERKDWRKCRIEVEKFKLCMKYHLNIKKEEEEEINK